TAGVLLTLILQVSLTGCTVFLMRCRKAMVGDPSKVRFLPGWLSDESSLLDMSRSLTQWAFVLGTSLIFSELLVAWIGRRHLRSSSLQLRLLFLTIPNILICAWNFLLVASGGP